MLPWWRIVSQRSENNKRSLTQSVRNDWVVKAINASHDNRGLYGTYGEFKKKMKCQVDIIYVRAIVKYIV